jgi:F-type H+-transporting ATPase subunit a
MGEILSTSGSLIASTEQVSLLGVSLYIGLVLILIFGYLSFAKKGINSRVFKNKLTGTTEQLYLFVENMCVNIIGGHGRKYVPFIIGLWMVIFVGNMVALFFPYSPTADLSFNLALALTSVAYVQYEGIRTNGLLGHVSHFAGPKLGGLMAVLISPIIFAIEVVSELMKNVSLSLRLFGNIHGGHQAVEAMNELGHGYYVPFGEFLLPIKLLTVIVQAMIFTLLTCVYLSLVTHHESEHTHSEHDAHGTPVPA